MRRAGRNPNPAAAAWTGVWVVDKPPDCSSLDVIRAIKAWVGPLKMGHTGTLDPMATGVLPVLVGSATKLLNFLHLEPKRYRGAMELGVETDSWDATGRVVSRNPWLGLATDRIETTFAALVGRQLLQPPVFSAIKYQGRPLYSYARRGLPVLPAARPVTIQSLTLLKRTAARLDFEIACSRGTYVRAVVREVGSRLGCGACLVSLRRLQCGPFALEHSFSLEHLKSVYESGRIAEALIPPSKLLEHLRSFEVDEQSEERVRQGNSLRRAPPEDPAPEGGEIGEPVRVLARGRLVAVAELRRDAQGFLLQPIRVLE